MEPHRSGLLNEAEAAAVGWFSPPAGFAAGRCVRLPLDRMLGSLVSRFFTKESSDDAGAGDETSVSAPSANPAALPQAEAPIGRVV